MIYGLYTSAGGAKIEVSRVDAIANNLANSATPGFRRDLLSIRERAPEAIEDRVSARHLDPLLDRLGGGPLVHHGAWDQVPGAMEDTRRTFDLAIEGDGFFAVRPVEGGATFYTRAGNFTRRADGQIVTADGRYAAIGDGGNPVAIPRELSDDQVLVGPAGTFTTPEGAEIGALQVVRFADAGRLEKQGDTLFRAPADARPLPLDPATAQVRQGFLERSTTDSVGEMVGMISAMRAYESNMQMIRLQDGTLDRVVNDVGRVRT